MSLDVVVVGAGPAGLTAALNLARARRRVLVLDSNRPRNAATFSSHGYLTRDGVSPLQLRKLGLEELTAYPNVEYAKTIVTDVAIESAGFVVTDRSRESSARAVLLATGVTETFPALPSIRAFYGTSIHSCVNCDAYEYADRPIALVGETDDLADRALILSQWSRDLIVFTNGVAPVSTADEARLISRGIRVDRRIIDDVVGNHDGVTGIRLLDGEVVPRVGVFIRPLWTPSLAFTARLRLSHDSDGFVEVDAVGRATTTGVYAAGDCASPGPQQLIIAAGAGATAADGINHDLVALD